MFQFLRVVPHTPWEQNIAFGLKRDKLPKAEIASRVNGGCLAGAYAGVRQTQTASASGGQRQRGPDQKPCQAPEIYYCSMEAMGALDKSCEPDAA